MKEKAFKRDPKKLYGSIVFFTSVLFVFYKYILEVSPSIMTKHLMLELKIDAVMVGHIAASFYYAYTIMQLPSGLFIDTFGSRRVATIGLLLCSFGALIFGYSHDLYLIFIARFLIGMGASVSVVNAFKIAANWFPERWFSFLTGLTIACGTMGAVFGQAPLSYFMERIGWRSSFVDLSILGFIFSAIFFFIVRSKPKRAINDMRPRIQGQVSLLRALLHVIGRKQNWFLSVYSGLAFTPVISFGALWGVPFVEMRYNIDRTSASFLTSFIFLGFALGAPLLGLYSSYIGKRKPVLFWGTFFGSILLALAIYLPPVPLFLYATLNFFIGFSLSAYLLSFSLIKEISLPVMTATAVGFMNAFNGLIGAITDPLIGFFLDITRGANQHHLLSSLRDYHLSFLILPVYLAASLILIKFFKETRCKQTQE